MGDLDGDGAAELVVADANQLRVLDRTGRQLAAAPAIAGIQVLVVADVDGDGRAEILAGWGASREHLAGPARVTLHRYRKGALTADTVFAPETARQDVVSVVPIPEEKSILIGYFDSKYMVSAVVARPAAAGWQIDKLGSVRTASSFARGDVDGDGRPDVVVGRVYGDERGVDGDAFVLRPDGARTPIPTTRGLRSLAVVDADGDGALEVLLADGWHQNYGTTARALLTWSRYVDGAFRSELIEDTPGQYAIEKIVPARAGGRTLIVALGSSYVRVFARHDGRWQGLTIAGTARDIAVGDVDGTPGDELLILGDRTEIVGLSDLPWPSH
ncbi:MAG: FG-GAP repeat domain-containing protein [Kofleriaceae bacterium]